MGGRGTEGHQLIIILLVQCSVSANTEGLSEPLYVIVQLQEKQRAYKQSETTIVHVAFVR